MMKLLSIIFILLLTRTAFGQTALPGEKPGDGFKTVPAQKGDTVETMAKRYKIEPVDVARINKVESVDFP